MNQQRNRHFYAGMALAIVLVIGQGSVIKANSQVTAPPQTAPSGLVIQAGLLWGWITSSVENLLGVNSSQQADAGDDDGACPKRTCGGGGGSGGPGGR